MNTNVMHQKIGEIERLLTEIKAEQIHLAHKTRKL